MAWMNFWQVIALVCVIEGLLPFLSPTLMRKAWLSMAQLDDNVIRMVGLVSMITGVVVLYLVSHRS